MTIAEMLASLEWAEEYIGHVDTGLPFDTKKKRAREMRMINNFLVQVKITLDRFADKTNEKDKK